MRATTRALAVLALAGTIGIAGAALADDGATYEVTITNVTRGQVFTPILAVAHQPGVALFELGQPASAELEDLAEMGNTVPLADLLHGNPLVDDIATAGDVLVFGQSVTLTLEAERGRSLISLAAMLVPTNDGFVALNGVRAPRGNKTRTVFARAYDAGTEANDESCNSIPGPPFVCDPAGLESPDGEGYVHVHAGIHGGGDLDEAERDWRNPVARVIIRRISDD